ncbi:RNase adapter RapZ [Neisseria sp. Ec49-e6-T10]|uniref:RNase adapter RapZ n=1 Tax=Neisseria sp. Ec49-e6-T10 TaxID=3140744 RepID=UPI003EBF7814
MRLILISGLSGSGKSVALKFLEDLGFFCVDNLPLALLDELIEMHQQTGVQKLAISVDTRAGHRFTCFAQQVQSLRQKGIHLDLLFLESTEAVLIKRFSETRRRHPLASANLTLEEAIVLEKELLMPIQEQAHRIDTSFLSTPQLRAFIKQWLGMPPQIVHLVFESFGYKYGLPIDADFVFDVRCLPNPHYDSELTTLTGLDQPICDFFQDKKIVWQMIDQIEIFLKLWLPYFQAENRHYLTVAIGCTGGQHRSVFVSQRLLERFANIHAQVRHRQLNR